MPDCKGKIELYFVALALAQGMGEEVQYVPVVSPGQREHCNGNYSFLMLTAKSEPKFINFQILYLFGMHLKLLNHCRSQSYSYNKIQLREIHLFN